MNYVKWHLVVFFFLVTKVPSVIAPADRDQYDNLLCILDPTKEMHFQDEALLVVSLWLLTVQFLLCGCFDLEP